MLSTQGWNRYSYVHNNPLSFTDPSGYGRNPDEEPCEPCGESPPVAPPPYDGPFAPRPPLLGWWAPGHDLWVERSNLTAALARMFRRRLEPNAEPEPPPTAATLVRNPPDWMVMSELAQYLYGAVDAVLEGLWTTPGPSPFRNSPATLTGIDYSSPFPDAQTSEGQLLRDLGPTAAVVITRRPTGTTGRAAGSIDDLVRAAQKRYPRKAGKIENHHVDPMFLGGAKDGLTIPLDAAYHHLITNEFRTLWGHGRTTPTTRELEELMRQVYETFPLPGP